MEKHKVRELENRVLRRIFGPKREEVAGDWSRLHSEDLHNLYISRNIIRVIKSRRMRWVVHVVRIGNRKKYKIPVEYPERKRPLVRLRRRREDTIRKYLGKLGWEGVNRILRAQDRDH
jgi:hypothetical protein